MHQEILLPEVTLPTLEATERPLPCVPPVAETRETSLWTAVSLKTNATHQEISDFFFLGWG